MDRSSILRASTNIFKPDQIVVRCLIRLFYYHEAFLESWETTAFHRFIGDLSSNLANSWTTVASTETLVTHCDSLPRGPLAVAQRGQVERCLLNTCVYLKKVSSSWGDDTIANEKASGFLPIFE